MKQVSETVFGLNLYIHPKFVMASKVVTKQYIIYTPPKERKKTVDLNLLQHGKLPCTYLALSVAKH